MSISIVLTRFAWAVVLLVAITAGCHERAGDLVQADADRRATSGQRLADHLLACVGRLERGEWTAFEQDCVATRVVVREMDGVTAEGPDAMIAWIDHLRTAFPDFHVGVEVALVDERDVFMVARITGTQRGTLHAPVGDISPSGRPIGILALVHAVVDEAGRVTESNVYVDPRALLGQLGAFPEDAPPMRPALPRHDGSPVIVVRAGTATERSNAEVMRRFTDAVNAHRVADVLALVSDSAIDSDAGVPADRSGRAVKDMYEGVLADIPDYHRDVRALYAIGDYVVAPGIKTGTWGNSKVELHYAEVIRFENGKLAEVRRFYNVLAMGMQIEKGSR